MLLCNPPLQCCYLADCNITSWTRSLQPSVIQHSWHINLQTPLSLHYSHRSVWFIGTPWQMMQKERRLEHQWQETDSESDQFRQKGFHVILRRSCSIKQEILLHVCHSECKIPNEQRHCGQLLISLTCPDFIRFQGLTSFDRVFTSLLRWDHPFWRQSVRLCLYCISCVCPNASRLQIACVLLCIQSAAREKAWAFSICCSVLWLQPW